MSDLVTVPGGTVGTWSPLILRTPGIAQLLGVDRVVPLVPGKRYDAIVGWGRKPNADWSGRYAAVTGTPFFRLEDGFLRSVGLGKDGEPPMSIVVDDLGIYYDASRPSRLERQLASQDPRLRDPQLLARADAAIGCIREHGLSKYNRARDVFNFRREGRRNVLVVDQVGGDLSLRYGGGDSAVARGMLLAASEENPEANLWYRGHPDGRRSALGSGRPSRLLNVVPATANPIRMLEQMDRVYVLTSLLGFEALLCGAQVSVFGKPFYAGWGLTDDRQLRGLKGHPRSLTEVFAAAYLLYSRYLSPTSSSHRGTSEDVLGALAQCSGPLKRQAWGGDRRA